jgi:hypothetical protein
MLRKPYIYNSVNTDTNYYNFTINSNNKMFKIRNKNDLINCVKLNSIKSNGLYIFEMVKKNDIIQFNMHSIGEIVNAIYKYYII